jgi:hypothetical protein
MRQDEQDGQDEKTQQTLVQSQLVHPVHLVYFLVSQSCQLRFSEVKVRRADDRVVRHLAQARGIQTARVIAN